MPSKDGLSPVPSRDEHQRENPAAAPARANRGRILISCPDRPGIVAAVARLLFAQGANIVRSDQHTTDPVGGSFFMRVEFDLPELAARKTEISEAFSTVATRLHMDWRLALASPPKRVAVLVSKEGHCLNELLWRHQSGELPGELTLVVSNHRDLGPMAAAHGIPFHHIPTRPGAREETEARQRALLEAGSGVDLIVLARYMQILSPEFVSRYRGRIINIHHSFLPAFAGGNPYRQAYDRGVKIIGATAHYVTADLDAGPIIEQDVLRVTHRDNAEDMRRVGRQIERAVLARAVIWHLEDRVLLHGNRTVVFG